MNLSKSVQRAIDKDCRIHVVATERHFADHLIPVWHALPPEARGEFRTGGVPQQQRPVVERARELGVPEVQSYMPKGARGVVLVAAVGDLARAMAASNQLHAAYFEHGCGLTYNREQTSHIGSTSRDGVRLFLMPNQQSADLQAAATPDVPIEVIGSSPKLDAWTPEKIRRRPAGAEPVVAISWHYDAKWLPELGSALPFYRKGLASVAAASRRRGWRLVGHAHPRIADEAQIVYRVAGIEWWPHFDRVLAEADLYCVDNSSTLYEFAATDKPVIAMNCPRYRRNVHHGLRFWEHVPGLQCDQVEDLADTIDRALSDPPEAQEARRAAVSYVYPQHDGRAAERAAEAVLRLLGDVAQSMKPPRGKRAVGWQVELPNGELTKPLLVESEARRLAAKRGGTVVPTTR